MDGVLFCFVLFCVFALQQWNKNFSNSAALSWNKLFMEHHGCLRCLTPCPSNPVRDLDWRSSRFLPKFAANWIPIKEAKIGKICVLAYSRWLQHVDLDVIFHVYLGHLECLHINMKKHLTTKCGWGLQKCCDFWKWISDLDKLKRLMWWWDLFEVDFIKCQICHYNPSNGCWLISQNGLHRHNHTPILTVDSHL